MSISIKCSRLNREFRNETSTSSPTLEVFVRFDDMNLGKPISIMCDGYLESNYSCAINNHPCAYSQWKGLKIKE